MPKVHILPLTDQGNAQRLVARHGRDLRYCHAWKAWLVWDGCRWHEDTNGEAIRRAKDTIAAIRQDSRLLGEKKRSAYLKFANRSESAQRIGAMLQLAQSEPGVPLQPQDLDAKPWLLNCANGTLDLRTGELREARREDLITKMTPVAYDPGARSDLWARFLCTVTNRDAQLQQFLRRAVGNSAVGVEDETVTFCYGPGGTGKTTFVEAIKAALGEYALTLDFDTLIERRFAGGPRNDIARLDGARFVAASEVDAGRRLASALVKSLTGGEKVTARFLYGESFEFKPQLSLWLAVNHLPAVSLDDDGLWRRIRVIPFVNVVPPEQRDRTVKARLCDPADCGPAVLAWIVQGCLEWQESGLRDTPRLVTDATTQYRQASDPLSGFIEDCCTMGEEQSSAVGELNHIFDRWASDNRIGQLSPQEFNSALEARGCKQVRVRSNGRQSRVWKGIGIRAGA